MDETPTFRAVFPQASKFKKIFQPLTKLFESMPLYITQDGIDIRSMSSDKNTMVIFDMPSTSFEEYQLEEEKLVVKIDSDEFGKVVKRGTRDDAVIMEYEKGSPYMIIKFLNRKTSVEREFKIQAFEVPEEEMLDEPQVELKVTAKMDPTDLRHVVADAKIVSDEVEVNTPDNETLTFSAFEANKSYEAELKLYNPLTALVVDEPSKAKYSVQHLYDATRAYQAAKELTLEYATDMPMKIEMQMEAGTQLRLWIAPRV